MANNLLLILAVVISVLLLSGGLTGNQVYSRLRVPSSPTYAESSRVSVPTSTDVTMLDASTQRVVNQLSTPGGPYCFTISSIGVASCGNQCKTSRECVDAGYTNCGYINCHNK